MSKQSDWSVLCDSCVTNGEQVDLIVSTHLSDRTPRLLHLRRPPDVGAQVDI